LEERNHYRKETLAAEKGKKRGQKTKPQIPSANPDTPVGKASGLPSLKKPWGTGSRHAGVRIDNSRGKKGGTKGGRKLPL